MLSASNPKLQILDTLGKFSHDSDAEVAHNAILAMGIVGAGQWPFLPHPLLPSDRLLLTRGESTKSSCHHWLSMQVCVVCFSLTGTNNARLGAMLRQLAVYHAKDPSSLFCVRLAQGLAHLGKGTLTVCPYHSDRQIMSPVAVAGLLAVLVACLDTKNSWVLGVFCSAINRGTPHPRYCPCHQVMFVVRSPPSTGRSCSKAVECKGLPFKQLASWFWALWGWTNTMIGVSCSLLWLEVAHILQRNMAQKLSVTKELDTERVDTWAPTSWLLGLAVFKLFEFSWLSLSWDKGFDRAWQQTQQCNNPQQLSSRCSSVCSFCVKGERVD